MKNQLNYSGKSAGIMLIADQFFIPSCKQKGKSGQFSGKLELFFSLWRTKDRKSGSLTFRMPTGTGYFVNALFLSNQEGPNADFASIGTFAVIFDTHSLTHSLTSSARTPSHNQCNIFVGKWRRQSLFVRPIRRRLRD